MDPKSKAKAVAQLDAVCDEYERNFDSLGEDESLAPWLERVSPELRMWLREELVALRTELKAPHAPRTEEEQREEVPAGIDPSVWQAVTDCESFHALSYDAKLALAAGIEPRTFSPDSVLLQMGMPSAGLFLITSGEVSIVAVEGDVRHELDHDGIGSVLGEMSMITGHPCSADVVAASDVEALMLPVDAYRDVRERHPEVEIALSQLVSDRLGHRSRDALCGKSFGGFRLHRCISRGAMGVVYAAEEEATGTAYALKMLRHGFIYSPQVVSRFEQEAELLSQLEHANVVSVRGHFVAYRTRFIVLDLYDGADLRTVLRRHGPIPESTARAVLGQIAAGLHHAHRAGILHLDLKPANILIDQQGNVAITDFGLSRLIESDGVDEGVVGTPLYMPPEQFTMSDVGPHCDWYALGCVAAEVLTGTPIFKSQDRMRFMEQKLQKPSANWPEVEATSELREHLEGALQPVVERRQLDLAAIADWARPVPELADVLFREAT